jgi:hypothetical protein
MTDARIVDQKRRIAVPAAGASCPLTPASHTGDARYFTDFALSQQPGAQQPDDWAAGGAGGSVCTAAPVPAQQMQHGHSSHGHSTQHSGGQFSGVQHELVVGAPLRLAAARAEPPRTATIVVMSRVMEESPSGF